MIWQAFFKKSRQRGERKVSKSIHFVDYRLEVFKLSKTLQNRRKLTVIDTTVAKQYSIDESVIKELTGAS